MPQFFKVLLIKAAVGLGILVALVALFNSTTFTDWLRSLVQVATWNVFSVLNAGVDLIALALVVWFLWSVFLKKKPVHKKRRR